MTSSAKTKNTPPQERVFLLVVFSLREMGWGNRGEVDVWVHTVLSAALVLLFFVGIVDFVEMREEPRERGRERGGRECCYGLMTPPSQHTKLTTSPHPSPSSSAGATPFCRHVLPLLVFSFWRGVKDVGRGEVDVWRIIVVAVGAFFFVSRVDGGWGGVVTNSWERGDDPVR